MKWYKYSQSSVVAMTFVGLASLLSACAAHDEAGDDLETQGLALEVADDTTTTIVGVGSDKCIGIKGSSSSNGATLQQQGCSGSDFQTWTASLQSDGYYTLKNKGSGLCMDVPGASDEKGINLIQWACGTKDNQKWSLTDRGNGKFSIISKSSGLAVDVEGASTANGAKIVQWTYKGSSNQLWSTDGSSSNETSIAGFGSGVTGGTGGEVVTVSTVADLTNALCGSTSGGVCTDDTARIIRVNGVIDFRGTEGTTTGKACTYSNNGCSMNGKYEKILDTLGYCDGRTTYDVTYDTAGKSGMLVGSNKTLIGVGSSSGIKGKGLVLKGGVSNIIIRNLAITDINDGLIWAGDALTLDNTSKVWIDHNEFARIGRQMIVAGWGTAQNVTISNNYFNGVTEYGHYCDGRHYWTVLLLGEDQSVTLVGNKFYNTSGRSPKVGKGSSATSGGVVHVVNNYWESNYYMGLEASEDVVTLIEGNYFSTGDYFTPVNATSSSLVYAPLDGNVGSTSSTCAGALGRSCVSNYTGNSTDGFVLNSSVMSSIQGNAEWKAAMGSVVPAAYSDMASNQVGPSADIQ